MMSHIAKYVAMLIVFSMVAAVSPLAYASPPRVLAASEMEEIEGGAVCGGLETVFVVAAICTIASLGYIVVRDWYNARKEGNQPLQPVTVIIKIEVQHIGDGCVQTAPITVNHYTIINN